VKALRYILYILAGVLALSLLYLASASTFPGGGIEAVVIAGMICANDICNWRVKMS